MKLAIFDFDGTLFPKDTLPFLLKQWKKRNYPRIKYINTYVSLIFLYIRYKSGIKSDLTREQMKIIAVERFNKIFINMTEQELKEFFYLCSKELEGLLSKSIISEVEDAKLNGYHTVLLSGSYDYLLHYIGEFLKFDTVIGTKVPIYNHLFDSCADLEVITGKLKVEKINETFESVDWEASIAYADSYSDTDILQSVGIPVAVNPDKKLKALATERKWRIIS